MNHSPFEPEPGIGVTDKDRIFEPRADETLEPTDRGWRAASTRPGDSPSGATPQRIGPYRILGQLGQGGMGVVYLAEQTEPVRRRVALKMLRSGLPHRELQIRFEAERQAMARLHHPNVAQLYEAGSTEGGRPYFVMERVDGIPITEYCDRARLGIRDRIELFQAVCEGVQHAHEKGLLHRDLKPSNILVTEDNGRPVPKVLDFGIAKAIDQPLVEGTLTTGERVIGTPAYLSPEAVSSGSGIDVDTRSDVYSLGVMLYELLVGVRPFETQGVAFVRVLRKISEEEPTGPSVKWSDLEPETRAHLAESRRHDVASLPRRLRGDLDWIVMKAIAKDRGERYPSAANLAADLGRHLREEPVEASPPSVLYRMRKFARRRRGVVTAAAALLLSLVLGLTGTLVNLERAQREAERASREAERANQEAAATQQALEETEEISDFLQSLFEVSDPSEARGNTVTARELLDRGAEKIRAELESRPLTRARFMVTIGEVYESLGLYDQAEPLLEDALATRETELEEDSLEIARVVNSLGRLRFTQGRLDDAGRHFRRALEIRERMLEPDHPDLASSLNHLAFLLTNQGRYDEAEPLHRRGLEIEEQALGPEHPDLVMGLTTLGALYHAQAKYDEAEPLLRRALAIREATLEPDHPDLAGSLVNLANVLTSQGSHEEAETLYLRCLEIQETALGPDHPKLAMGLGNLAWLYQEQGRYQESEPLYRRALDIFEKTFGPDHPNNALILNGLGFLASEQGRYREAEKTYRRALDIRESALGPDHPEVASILVNLADIYGTQGRRPEAERLHRRALEIQEQALGPDHPSVAASLEALARLHHERGQYAEAEPLFQRSLSIREGQSTADPEALLKALDGYAQLLRAAGREGEARELEARAGAGLGLDDRV